MTILPTHKHILAVLTTAQPLAGAALVEEASLEARSARRVLWALTPYLEHAAGPDAPWRPGLPVPGSRPALIEVLFRLNQRGVELARKLVVAPDASLSAPAASPAGGVEPAPPGRNLPPSPVPARSDEPPHTAHAMAVLVGWA